MLQGLRSFDAETDLLAVLDLIALGFEGELDPKGQKALAEMRQMATPSAFGSQVSRGTSASEVGFVWVEDGRIAGNLSLRHALPHSSGGRLIGNVVVHPEYRGRGIARALMTAAVDAARQRGARWVGLEVRADNATACTLYEHLGFVVVGRTFHLLRPQGAPWPAYPQPREIWRRSRPKDSSLWLAMAEVIHEYNQRKVVEVARSAFVFGSLDRVLDIWLSRQREQAWLCDRGEHQMAVRVRTDLGYHFHVWDILVHPADRETYFTESVAKALQLTRRYRPWSTIAVIPDQPLLVGALEDVGFRLHRTLLQMILDL